MPLWALFSHTPDDPVPCRLSVRPAIGDVLLILLENLPPVPLATPENVES
jgi:hypothetical protein